MNGVVVVTAPDSLPVTLDDAKAHLRVVTTDEDALIAVLIEAATDYAESFLGRALVARTLDRFMDAFPTGAIELPLPPLISVTGVFYVDTAGVEQEFTTFEVDTASEPGRVYLVPTVDWPTPRVSANAVRVRYRAGYVDATVSPASGVIPQSIEAAILLIIGTLYEHRETVVIGQTPALVPWSAEQLLRRHRVELSMA